MKAKVQANIWQRFLPEILIVVVIFVFYGNTINNGYSLDDIYVVQDNEQIQQGVAGLGDIFTSFYATLKNDDGQTIRHGYRPIVKVSYAIEYQFFGDNPTLHHFFNILYYVLAAILLYRVFRKLIRKVEPQFILLGVLLWVMHPIHTEVVASLKNRDEILVVIFGILSLNFFIKYVDKEKFIYLVLASLFLLLAYFSKASAMVFLGIIPLSIYFFRENSLKRILIPTAVLLVVALIGFYFPKLILETQFRPVKFYENPLAGRSTLITRFAPSMAILFFYVRMLFVPYPMSFYYGYNQAELAGFGDWKMYAGFLIHGALFVYAVLNIKKKTPLVYFIFFYLISISIYANLVKAVMGIVADRFLFTPSIGFSFALIFLFIRIEKKTKVIRKRVPRMIYTLVVLVAIPSFFLTTSRNADWKSALSLMKADIDHLENSAKANFLYANTIRYEMIRSSNLSSQKRKNDLLLMEKYYKKAIDIYEGYYEAWNQLGELNMLMKGDLKTAEKCFNKAIYHHENYATPFANLGYLYNKQKDYTTAIDYYLKALKIDQSEIRTISNLANCYANVNDFESAFSWNKKIKELNATIELPYYNDGKFWIMQGDTLQGMKNWEKAIELNPKNKNILIRLTNYFIEQENKEKANYYRQLAIKAGVK